MKNSFKPLALAAAVAGLPAGMAHAQGPDPEPVPGWFNIGLLPGILVDAAAAQHGLDHPDNAIVSDYPKAVLPHAPGRHGVFKQARALTFSETDEWQPVGRLLSSPRSWNETGSLRGHIARNPDAGELAGPLTVGLALQRRSTEPPQRAIFIGGRHFISNDQIGQGANMELAVGLLNWLVKHGDNFLER